MLFKKLYIYRENFCVVKFSTISYEIPDFTYRLLNREESFEKKLMRPGWGDSPGTPPVAEYSKAVLLRGLV